MTPGRHAGGRTAGPADDGSSAPPGTPRRITAFAVGGLAVLVAIGLSVVALLIASTADVVGGTDRVAPGRPSDHCQVDRHGARPGDVHPRVVSVLPTAGREQAPDGLPRCRPRGHRSRRGRGDPRWQDHLRVDGNPRRRAGYCGAAPLPWIPGGRLADDRHDGAASCGCRSERAAPHRAGGARRGGGPGRLCG